MVIPQYSFSWALALFVAAASTTETARAWSSTGPHSRRQALEWMVGNTAAVVASSTVVMPGVSHAVAEQPEGVDVDEFLRTGTYGMPMGVSGQSGKSRPETGVVLREGTDVARDARTGDVSAEILLKPASSSSSDMVPVFTSYSSPWPLATGAVFDIECRDLNSGDAAFLAVSRPLQGQTLADMKDSFFVKELTKPTGRFSLYGQPTDIKVKNSILTKNDKYRQFDLSFSTLSQSTQAEIPRRARVVVTIPEGTDQAVMLVASASANRWKNGAEKTVAAVVNSFQAIPAPSTSLKIRAKPRPNAAAESV